MAHKSWRSIGAYLAFAFGSIAPDATSIWVAGAPNPYPAYLHSPVALAVCLGILVSFGVGFGTAVVLRHHQGKIMR